MHTLPLFLRDGVHVESIESSQDVATSLRAMPRGPEDLRLVVLEGREALRDVADDALESALHVVNSFVRSPAGERTLVVWLCNTEELAARLVGLGRRLGGTALLGAGSGILEFLGPPRASFRNIGDRTVRVLNNGATIADLGVSEDKCEKLLGNSATVGEYLTRLRGELAANRGLVESLMLQERCRLWILVVAGNDPDSEVAALTRGHFSAVDIDRLSTATESNAAEELRSHPEKIGILCEVLEAKILFLPHTLASAVVRDFGAKVLESWLGPVGSDPVSRRETVRRVTASEMGSAFLAKPQGMRRGLRRTETQQAFFTRVVAVASTQDGLLNDAVGTALLAAGLVTSAVGEAAMGNEFRRRSDLLCGTARGPVRVEVMWRAEVGRAEIANYVLTKLLNYGKAIGFLT